MLLYLPEFFDIKNNVPMVFSQTIGGTEHWGCTIGTLPVCGVLNYGRPYMHVSYDVLTLTATRSTYEKLSEKLSQGPLIDNCV